MTNISTVFLSPVCDSQFFGSNELPIRVSYSQDTEIKLPMRKIILSRVVVGVLL